MYFGSIIGRQQKKPFSRLARTFSQLRRTRARRPPVDAPPRRITTKQRGRYRAAHKPHVAVDELKGCAIHPLVVQLHIPLMQHALQRRRKGRGGVVADGDDGDFHKADIILQIGRGRRRKTAMGLNT